MGPWQPDVKRHDARLGSESDDRQQEHEATKLRREMRRAGAQIGERRALGAGREQQEHRQQRHETELRHRDVPQPRVARLGHVRLGHHQKVRRERHQLPREQERKDVPRAGHHAHAQQKDVEHQAEEPQRRAPLVRRGIRHAVDRRRQAADGDDGEEEGAERVNRQQHAARRGEHTRQRQHRWLCGHEHLRRDGERRDAADDRAEGRDVPGGTAGGRHERETRPAYVAGEHQGEREASRHHRAA